MRRRTCSPETEVIGTTLISFIDNLQSASIVPLLEEHGMANIQPDQWYPLSPWLDVIYELSDQPGFSSNMIAIGMKIIDYAVTPEEMQGIPLDEMLDHWNEHFQLNHRNGDVGYIVTEKVKEKYYRTIHNNIYPDDFNYGILYGFAQALLPEGSDFEVWYEDYNNRIDLGDNDETVISVRW